MSRFLVPTIDFVPPPVVDPGDEDSLLLESGDYLLLESGDKLLLE